MTVPYGSIPTSVAARSDPNAVLDSDGRPLAQLRCPGSLPKAKVESKTEAEVESEAEWECGGSREARLMGGVGADVGERQTFVWRGRWWQRQETLQGGSGGRSMGGKRGDRGEEARRRRRLGNKMGREGSEGEKRQKKENGVCEGRRRSHGRVKPQELIVLPTIFFSPLILFRSKVEIQKFRSLNFVFV
jgi:hypothetical protein